MYLPGTIHDRIGDLRSRNNLSQKKLAEMIEIAPSQLSRIENGETQSVSSDILIKLAKAFGVSTDYILGLTTISTPKSREISELGLSESAIKGLINGSVDVQMLNRLLEHKSFPYLLYMIKTYFDNSIAAGIMARNAVIDMATATLGDFVKDNPEHKLEAQADARRLKSEKLTDHEAEITKINSTFLAILRDIKKDIEDGKTPEVPSTAEFTRQMMEQVQALRRKGKTVKAEDMAAIMTNVVGKAVPMDEGSTEAFKKLAEQVLKGK